MSDDQQRTRVVSVYLTEDEWQDWERRRQAAGHDDLGDWVRAVVRVAAGQVPTVTDDARRELARLGDHLSQMARYLHVSGQVPAGLDDTLAAVRRAAAALAANR